MSRFVLLAARGLQQVLEQKKWSGSRRGSHGKRRSGEYTWRYGVPTAGPAKVATTHSHRLQVELVKL